MSMYVFSVSGACASVWRQSRSHLVGERGTSSPGGCVYLCPAGGRGGDTHCHWSPGSIQVSWNTACVTIYMYNVSIFLHMVIGNLTSLCMYMYMLYILNTCTYTFPIPLMSQGWTYSWWKIIYCRTLDAHTHNTCIYTLMTIICVHV